MVCFYTRYMRTTHKLHRSPGRPRAPRTILTTVDVESENLRAFAQMRGFDQQAVAFAAGVSYSMARQYMNGHKRIPDHRLERIARALQIHPQQIRPNFQAKLELQGVSA